MAKKITYTPEQLKRAYELRDNHTNKRKLRSALLFFFMVVFDHTDEETANFNNVTVPQYLKT
ncbi:MAG: hypothetical protein LBG48_00075 [Rickettsiales bacterium]|jgi:hypothetical protein|nr:hypothetical protein [Rickettsiales bacterium]